jgi:hypothetical protein
MATDRHAPTPVGAVVRRLGATAVGTLAMDLVLFARYKRRGGKIGLRDCKLSSEVETWDQTPAQVGKRLVEGLFSHVSCPTGARRWSTTSRAGVPGCSPARRADSWSEHCTHPASGSAFPLARACGRWATSFCPPPSSVERSESTTSERLADECDHLVYGLTAAAVFPLLSPGGDAH